MLSPDFKRYKNQYITFVLVWCAFGLTYVLVEYGILGNTNIYPSTQNIYSFKHNLIYVLPATFTMGLIQCYVELVVFRTRFQYTALWLTILIKTVFHIGLIILFLLAVATVNAIGSHTEGLLIDHIKTEVYSFISHFAIWSIVIYVGLGTFFALLLSEIGQHQGNSVFHNFLFGKYENPIEEVRIFMFLDMKDSTTIAENLGHSAYFKLIRNYYADMTNAILETDGEIYQYVGDEIVITWTQQKGTRNNNCVECFFKIEESINQNKEYYQENYGITPQFKAGIHIGEVMTGEIGILKKDIIYTGDVLNTSARIQGQCNTYNSKLIISNDMKEVLNINGEYSFHDIGEMKLKGKQKDIRLYDLKRNS